MPPTLKPPTHLFERRTVIVLATLMVSMTAVSGLLLVLEPAPLARSGGPLLTVLSGDSRGLSSIFATEPAPDPQRWRAIVIHHSGRPYGNAQTLAERHRALGRGGLGHHFVIGNGEGADDGEIQMGYRWTRQRSGRHVEGGEAADWYNRHAISICLVGDGDRGAPTRAQMEQIVRLTTALQARLEIPADHVLLHANIAETTGPGVFFPAAAFRQQLIDLDIR